MASDAPRPQVRTIRRAAVVIAAAMVLWMAGNWLGGRQNWPIAAAFALDIVCMAALVWAVLDVRRVRRMRQD